MSLEKQPLVSFETLSGMVEGCAFHRWMGITLREHGHGRVILDLPWRDEFAGDPSDDHMHGGLLATLIDLAADYAIATVHGIGVPTIDLHVDYHRIALPGPLWVEGSVVRVGRTLGTAEAKVYNKDGALIASGRGLFLTAIKPDVPPRSGP